MFMTFLDIVYTCIIGVRGMPERDIESLGVMGKGAGRGQEILPVAVVARTPAR